MNDTNVTTIGNLKQDTLYALDEIIAPEGHKLIGTVFFKITENGTDTGFVTWSTSMQSVNFSATDGGNVGTLVVPNYKDVQGYNLPNTGGVGTAIFTFGGIILVVGAALGLMLRKKDHESEE